MSPEHWRELQDLFHQLADKPREQQLTELDALCDGELRAEVEELLAADADKEPVADGSLPFLAWQLFEPGQDPYLGQTFGPYLLQALIGQGGMGRVYLAQRQDYGGVVALKILHDAVSPERRERFAAEQRILAQVTHPSIARLYDAGTLPDGTPFFAMEYVDGMSLFDYCRGRSLPLAERLRLFREICRAVQYLHQHAILHRDLKPSNIFVEENGSVKLLDFGIAESVKNSEHDDAGLRPRYMTLAYAAPEQVRGERASVQADIYALGVILQELLTNALPFDFSNRTVNEIRQMVLELAPRKPSQVAQSQDSALRLARGKWNDFDAICDKAMAKNPAKRYGSAESLLADCERVLASEPVEARRPFTFGYRSGKLLWRHLGVLAAVAAVLAIIAGLTGYYTFRLARARNTAVREAAKAQAVQSFIVNLFNGYDSAAGPSVDLRVVTLLERGETEARRLQGQPAVKAELFQTLGTIYTNLGRYGPADKLLRDALALNQHVYGPDSSQAAETMLALADLADGQAHSDQQLKWSRQAVAIQSRNYPAHDHHVADAQVAVGAALVSAGAYDRAIKVLEANLPDEMKAEHATRPLATNFSELAIARFYLGQYDRATELMKRGLTMDRQLVGDTHPDVASDLMTLGQLEEVEGHYAEAERDERESLRIYRTWFGDDHPETGSALTHVAQTLTYEGKTAESEVLLKHALAIQEHAHTGPHTGFAVTLVALGNSERSNGELDAAQAHLDRALAMFTTLFKGRDYRIGTVLSDMANVASDRKQYGAAEDLLQKAIAMFDSTLGPNSQNKGTAEVKLGHVLLLERRFDSAQTHSLSGYQVLLNQTDPPLDWVNRARADIAADCEQLHHNDQARTFEARLTAADLRKLRPSVKETKSSVIAQ